MIKPAIFLTLLFSTSVFAQPHITSVAPSSGPVTGGTTVIIQGSGFDTTCTPDLLVCGKTGVTFGSLPAASFQILDTQTIQAVTPAQVPGSVNVGVSVARGATQLPNAFTFTGSASDAFEPVLLPIFLPPIPGAFGSQFLTFFTIWSVAGDDTQVFSLNTTPPCQLGLCPPDTLQPIVLKARQGGPFRATNFDGNPGRILYIPKGSFDRIAASLRVADTSRATESAGTRVPVVRASDFRSDFLTLLDVPSADEFRYSLRIYSLDPGAAVLIRYSDSDSSVVFRQDAVTLSDPIDIFHPGFAQVTNFHPKQSIRIEIEPLTQGKRIWAFLAITNNVTQEITVVAPH